MRLAWLLLAGCATATSEPGTPDEPDTSALAAFTPITTAIDADEPAFVASLRDATLVVLDARGLVHLDGERVALLAAGADVASPSCAFALDGAIVLATSRGFYAAQDGEYFAIGPERRCLGVASVDAHTAWIASSPTEIELLRDGERERFSLGVAIDPGSLRAVDSERAFAIAGGHVVEIRSARRTAWEDARSIAMTPDGEVVVARADGSVWSGASTATLEELEGARGVTALHQAGAAIWMETSEGWLHLEAGALRRVANMPIAPDVTASFDGSLLARRSDGLTRISARWGARFEGLAAGEEILAPRAFTIATASPTPPAIEASISGVTLGALTLDPAELVPGDQRLTATLTFDDGTLPVELSLDVHIAGEPPTWSGAIEPLYRERCASCHGRSGARPLDTSMRWQALIDLVLFNVRMERMPKPPRAPLTPIEVARIEAWAQAGFPE